MSLKNKIPKILAIVGATIIVTNNMATLAPALCNNKYINAIINKTTLIISIYTIPTLIASFVLNLLGISIYFS